MNEILEHLELSRLHASRTLPTETKAELGQYMTPSNIAHYMASLFFFDNAKNIRLLDAGSGIGSLSIAVFERLIAENVVQSIDWVGYEIDKTLCSYLNNYLEQYKIQFAAKGINFSSDLRKMDFIEDTSKRVFINHETKFNFAILNPPYKKIQSQSHHRLLLHKLKIETVNLYSAFVALTIELMVNGGQIVAIIPRSFCNGPYYKSFRESVLQKTAIRHIHLFNARDKAFRDEHVLQENVIIFLERKGKQGDVIVSTSTDSEFIDYKETVYPFNQIVLPTDEEKFIHIPTSKKPNLLESSISFHSYTKRS